MENKSSIKLTTVLKEMVEEDINDFIAGDATCKFFYKFKAYYDTNTRHLYHELAYFMVDLDASEEIDYLIDKVYWIYTHSKDLSCETTRKKILKLYDHLKLEKVHFDSLEKLNNTLKNTQLGQIEQFTEDMKDQLENQSMQLLENISDAEKKIETVKFSLTDVQRDLKNSEKQMYTQVVAILGIFTSIVFSMFAGLTMINSIVQALSTNVIPFNKACAICLMIGFIVFNLLYTMLYAISKLTGNSIAYKHPKTNAEGFDKVGIIKKAAMTHPYCFWVNIITTTLLILLMCNIFFSGSTMQNNKNDATYNKITTPSAIINNN
ncbi:hypothetical protein [Niameybacter massiliensis]|uniref:hypothetical protein n=1 Tax=Niameybacter massiliensis TaxID=1658108 RepID=UPI0006B560BF|nr:hypothetical protein [Niameybacter massiliensis]